MRALPLTRPDDRHQQLADFGLREQYFHDAVQAGENARGIATRNDARNAAGSFDYFARVRTLREILFEEGGWRRMDHNQLPLVVNPDRTMAIGVLLGDYRTGIPGNPQPCSRRPQGAAKAELVSRNVELALFPPPRLSSEPDEAQLDEDELARLNTWFLLTYRYEGKRDGRIEVRSELSLPDGVGPHGKIDRWKRRILLAPLEWALALDYAGEQAADIDVPVEER